MRLPFTEGAYQAAKKAVLFRKRYYPCEDELPANPGVYALFLAKPYAALAAIDVPPSGLLYIGMTDASFDTRNHFTYRHSGSSSLRRSLGAVLKAELKLNAIPRGGSQSKNAITHYNFHDAGEQRLTAWMKRNLALRLAVLDRDVLLIERRLILELRPPLNMDKHNPQKPKLTALRYACRLEAAANFY